MLDAAIRALAEIFSKPMRAILWKSIGLALILMMRFRPEGLIPSTRVKQELHSGEVRP